MRRVRREDVLDYVTYGEAREEIRTRVLAQKADRRIRVGDVLTFLFENAETIRYQILEMVRVERLVKEAEIRHELETYNEILGGPGELGCTLLIEIADEADRAVKLKAWLDLPQHLYARLEDGSLIRPRFDERQVGEDRLSSVQFLKFDTGGQVPVALGSDLPALTCETILSASQREALAADLRSD